jgi:hypothetical protein
VRIFPAFVPVVLLVGLTASLGAGDDSTHERIKEGLDAFQAYLTKEYPGKKHTVGPTSIDSAAPRAAYRRQRFCYVFTDIPLRPGANIKEVQEAITRRWRRSGRTTCR